MAETAGDFLVGRMAEWGVRRVYGYPGDGINGVMGALQRAKERIAFVQVRHEEMAAFMACAHAKFTGEVGVCIATSGPGAIHLLNGLYDAKLDRQPVVAVVGQSATLSLGSEFQQEVDLLSAFKDVASAFVQQAATPEQVRHLVDRAFRIAAAERAVTCIILPHDVQEMEMKQPPRKHGANFSGVGWSPPRVLPRDEDLRRAADVLNAGERVAMLVGAGAKNAAAEVQQVAELLGAGVAKALLGKDVLADDLPYVTGSIGLLGTRASWELMQGCDTLLMVGSSFPYAEFLPAEGQARGVQVDLDPGMLSVRYPMEVPLQGDARETLRALLPLLRPKDDRSWRQRVEEWIADWWRVVEHRARSEADPINPQLVFQELSPRLPDQVVLTCDSGTAAIWFARNLKVREGMRASVSGGLASMGCGVPYAIAAKFAHPDRPVIALVGDGAMQMNGINELITAAEHWRDWADPRLVVLVLANGDLNMVTWEQRVMAGDPKFQDSQALPDFPYAAFAESIGLQGFTMRRPEDVAPVWEAALAATRPVLVEAHTDPNTPPLPPHMTFEQAKKMFEAMTAGDPDRSAVLKQSARQVLDSFLPR
jgi:pyruvate dehydrogenase (quinone)